MRRARMQKIGLIGILALLIFTLGACSLKNNRQPDEEALRQRVKNMMEAKIADDWGKVYDFQAPEYKQEVSKDQFLGINRNMSVLSYSIESIEMAPSGKEATVKVEFSASARGYEFSGMVNTQQWKKIKGTWYEKADTEESRPF
ncbi:MAG: hypothetical protein ACLFNS_12670 [Desulfobacterales bacterium]